jgi:hypothetical protein
MDVGGRTAEPDVLLAEVKDGSLFSETLPEDHVEQCQSGIAFDRRMRLVGVDSLDVAGHISDVNPFAERWTVVFGRPLLLRQILPRAGRHRVDRGNNVRFIRRESGRPRGPRRLSGSNAGNLRRDRFGGKKIDVGVAQKNDFRAIAAPSGSVSAGQAIRENNEPARTLGTNAAPQEDSLAKQKAKRRTNIIFGGNSRTWAGKGKKRAVVSGSISEYTDQ